MTARVQTGQVGPSVRAQLAKLPDLWQRRSALLASGLTRTSGLAERSRASAETALHRVRGQKPTASWPTQPQWPTPDSFDRTVPEWPAPLDDRSHADDMIDGVPAARFTATPRPTPTTETSPDQDQAAAFPAPSFYSFPASTVNADPRPGDEPPSVPEPPAAQPPAPAKPDAEWSWVEAAAATWLARRDADDDEDETRPAAKPSPPWSGASSSRRLPRDRDA
jgi:hypothetical protein